MKSVPEYYVTDLDLRVHTEPSAEDWKQGTLSVEFSKESPQFNEEESMFICVFDLELEVHSEEVADGEEILAEIDIEIKVVEKGDEERLRTEFERWDKGEYTDMSDEFIGVLESRIMYRILTPIQMLVESSFSGVVPDIRLTPEQEE